jgi:hypothetical protein
MDMTRGRYTKRNNKMKIQVRTHCAVARPLPSKIDLSPDTLTSDGIFRVCWGCSGEAMVKFSALYHDVRG